MGPVKLNKGNLINKAGVEVDVIPIMRSPCPSPKPRKKELKRPKSEMGFYKDRGLQEDDRGSLPDLKRSPLKLSIYDTVLKMKPESFLSNESLLSGEDNRMSRSLGSTDSIQKGSIVNAVTSWLQKSSPFSSTDNLEQQSMSTSAPDILDSNMSLYDDLLENSDDKSLSKSEHPMLPDIVVFSVDNTRDPILESAYGILETSCDQLTQAAVPLTQAETNQLPQPMPRNAITSETHLQSQTEEVPKQDKPKSPVRDDLLDNEDIPESYSDKKKFWETVTQEKSQKRMSLQEPSVLEKQTVAKKRVSIHEFGAPPIPKPRTALQTSQSLIETDIVGEVGKPADEPVKSVKDRALSFESSASDSSLLVNTDLTKISESDISPQDDRIMTEYQASFQPPTERKISPKKVVDFQKTESVESDQAIRGNNNLFENTGYISDSEDVEHYISDSEIEDRVPQIRDRMFSVFIPSTTSGRKSLYERSASLPTEDLYDVSARNIQLRKEYYEEQIRKEMIEEQLTSEIEEEPSPERKTLLSSIEDEQEHTDADSKSTGEDEADLDKTKTVSKLTEVFEPKKSKELPKDESKIAPKSLARSSEEKVYADAEAIVKLHHELEEKPESEEKKTTVKGLAKEYEKQLGNVVAGQRIGQSQIESRTFVLDKHKIDAEKHKDQTSKEIVDFVEVSRYQDIEEKSHKLEYIPERLVDTHKPEPTLPVDDQLSISPTTKSETHKEIEIETQHRQIESQYSFSSDKSGELVDEQNYKDDSHSTKPDSLEVLLDKSEIEDTEKLAELDQDLEGKSIDSLDTEGSPKLSKEEDEHIPEITVTLSGKQRRMSQESDEYPVKTDQEKIATKTAESPINVPQEQTQEIVWEVSVESQPSFYEKVEEITTKSPTKPDQESTVTQTAALPSSEMIVRQVGSHKPKEVDEHTEQQVQISRIEKSHLEDFDEHTPTDQIDSEYSRKVSHKLEGKSELADFREPKVPEPTTEETFQQKSEERDDLSADILQKFITEEKKMAEKIAMDVDKGLEEIAREKVSNQDYKEIMDQQDKISEQLEAKLTQQLLDSALEQLLSDDKLPLQTAEKDDDLSCSVKDESDLGSEIHQDHSESYESDKIKSDSHDEIEKIILESLHQQQVHPDEARKIASALLEEIEAEIEKRDSFPTELERPFQVADKAPASDFLKHLAETKGLDEREVELVESVLARRQRGLSKLTRGDTQASSMEITDEDLKYSGGELDYSHVLEQQMDQLEAEKINNARLDYDSFEPKRHQDKSGFVDKIDEEYSEETESSHDYESYADSKVTSIKKDIIMKTVDTVKGEKSTSEVTDVRNEDDTTITQAALRAEEKLKTRVDTDVREITHTKTDDTNIFETEKSIIEAKTDQESITALDKTEMKAKDSTEEKSSTITSDQKLSTVSAKYEADTTSTEVLEDIIRKTETKKESEYDEKSKEEVESTRKEISKVKLGEDGTKIETKLATDRTHSVTSSTVMHTDKIHEEIISVSSKVIEDPEELKNFVSTFTEEPVIKTHEIIKKTSSSESKSSSEKSPEDTESSERKPEPDLSTKLPEVILRKTKSDVDTSSSSSNLKIDRKSGIEFETYSSSGESHYHSFEMDSGKSRPCSSDVEGLVAAGSSEYESALTSQEYSAKSHMTSTEYQTAISSISSKDSMRSLDSESSGNLASVEVSEHSETLVPSTSDLEDMLDPADQQLLDDVEQTTAWGSYGPQVHHSAEISDSEMIPGLGGSLDISEEESSTNIKLVDGQSKMKRSQEMTFQPEPKVLVPDSPQAEFEEKLGTSLDEGSVLSVSMSSTSSTGAQRTVIELSRADSERLEGSMTVSGTSEHLSLDDVENMLRGSRESLITPTSHTADISTSTTQVPAELPIESVTITTSAVEENGIQSVSTQVTSESQSPIDEIVSFTKPEEPKRKGHRRTESSFVSSMISDTTRSEVEKKIQSDLAESDKYSKLSFKETSSDEKKDIDESEKEESYETEADQGFHRDLREGRYLDTESDNDPDISRPQSQFSKSDSERPTSDSELAELVKSSDITELTDPLERPPSPEPCDEAKDDTPEFSSEAQASVGELEQEYSSAVSRSHEAHMIDRKSVSSMSEVHSYKDPLEKRDSHGKSSSTSSEKSSFEEAEAEAAFSMVAHVSPAHKIKQICPILEDEDAEKHELETRERAQKEYEERRSQMLKDVSPGFVPDIKITQHMAPLVDTSFCYPDLELEAKEKEQVQIGADTPQTPASSSSKSSEETDQGKEYIVEDSKDTIAEEPELAAEEKVMMQSRSEVATVVEATLREGSEKGTDSPNSDSFEMLEKPDLIDDFVVIEEVGKEAQEFDSEGKSVRIGDLPKKSKKHDEEVEHYLAHSAPTPLTKMTDIKYYPDGTSSSEELGFDFEESPPQVPPKNEAELNKSSIMEYGNEYDRELEANRKWIEQQFKGDQAAMVAAGYGYEMEFERGPLEDIKEEDINDFAASSYGSQRDSGGSLKESYSSTPEYDVLAGRKYFTRSGENDDVSMSSLQEFENLEKAMSLEMRKFHHGSQDSSSNGSFKTRYIAGKSGQGDDISVSSLNEFEGLEKACIAVHKIEVKVKEEEAILSQIDEGQESVASESESCETVSGTEKKNITDTDDEEDYEKRMFEIDEIIKQAQTNVERFIDLKEAEKTESLGRGDSIEEVSKVPDLDLDAPLIKSTVKVQWKESEDIMITSTDSLDLKPEKTSHHDSTDSLDQKTGGDIMTASTDSIEFQVQKSTKDNIMTDSIEIKGDEKSYMVSSDSLELAAATSSGNNVLLSDSIDEDGSRVCGYDHSSSSTGKDLSSSTKDEADQEARGDYMLESIEGLDPTSSTATHATYQFDTDSVYSGSFTSGGSNTMVSSTNSIDQPKISSVDVAAAVRKVWFDEDAQGRRTVEYVEDFSKPYVTEVIEPSEDDYYSHTIHRKVELPPEVRKVTFTGVDAEEQMKEFMREFNEGEECKESEEIDEFGNVHVKKVVQRRFIVKSDPSGDQPMSGAEIEDYFRQLNQPEVVQGQGVITRSTTEGHGVITKTTTDGQGTKTTVTQQFNLPQTQLTTLTKSGDEVPSASNREPTASTGRAEGEETAEGEEHGYERKVTDQHQLSEEMKELLKELEKESKQ